LEQLVELNQNLKESSAASDSVSRALSRLTFLGIIVARLGVLVAAGHLILEVLKFISSK